MTVVRCPPKTSTTLQDFVLGRTLSAWPDTSLWQPRLAAFQKLAAEGLASGRFRAHVPSEEFCTSSFNDSVLPRRTLGQAGMVPRVFSCSSCTFECGGGLGLLWLHELRTHRDKRGVLECNRCGYGAAFRGQMMTHLVDCEARLQKKVTLEEERKKKRDCDCEARLQKKVMREERLQMKVMREEQRKKKREARLQKKEARRTTSTRYSSSSTGVKF